MIDGQALSPVAISALAVRVALVYNQLRLITCVSGLFFGVLMRKWLLSLNCLHEASIASN
ncbi:MAG: hypothetical protein WBI05_05935 [Rhodoferax sp.]|nr:hypothetical protein [Rhodoferax sp.]